MWWVWRVKNPTVPYQTTQPNLTKHPPTSGQIPPNPPNPQNFWSVWRVWRVWWCCFSLFFRVVLRSLPPPFVRCEYTHLARLHTRKVFSCVWLKGPTRLKCLDCSISVCVILKNHHTARMPCSVLYLIHHSRHLHRAPRLPPPYCSLQIGHHLLLRCLADLPNNPSSKVMSPKL